MRSDPPNAPDGGNKIIPWHFLKTLYHIVFISLIFKVLFFFQVMYILTLKNIIDIGSGIFI